MNNALQVFSCKGLNQIYCYHHFNVNQIFARMLDWHLATAAFQIDYKLYSTSNTSKEHTMNVLKIILQT